ncbi:hypothetical protein H072_2077 [Dactylellina haptotyla CBS 200.50]|uniref:Uncharacterized protein n=1 Tax=Dactylellina haptotyla (strain CBS 200.50) TaxID=1284197 RepID=S8ASA5_DACHA|nr:hypothetical protein H072_2077 [Dactylellina haptotyla CBS 200.50]
MEQPAETTTTLSSSSLKRTQAAASPGQLIKEAQSPAVEVEAKNDKSNHRGAEVLHNHLIIEYIVKYLPDVMDIIHLRRTCRGVAKDVKHYLVRNSKALDFSNTPGIHDPHIRKFLRGVSNSQGLGKPLVSFQFHQWDRLTHLDLSNTGVTEKLLANIIIQTFDGVVYSDHVSNFTPNSEANPECFMHLQSIKAQKCPELNTDLIVSLLQRLLFKRLDRYWEEEEAAVGLAWQVLRQVKSPIGSQIWRGPLPVNSEELERTGLIGYTRLKKLHIANSGKMAVEKRVWQNVEQFWNEEQCPYQLNAARYLCVTGALGIETELRFCNSYCDSPNVFLWDGWTMQLSDELEDQYNQMRLHHNVHKQIKTQGMSLFPKLEPENPIPRMPWEIRIELESGQTFYFPGSGADHKDQLHVDDLNLSTSIMCDSTVDTIVGNFDTYTIAEKRYALNKMTSINWERPEGWKHPEQRPPTLNEGYFAYLFRYCLLERNFQLYRYALPTAPRTDVTVAPPHPCIPDFQVRMTEVEYVIKRMLRCPLPRRIWLPNLINPNADHNWWEKRRVALLEFPRGLCDHCEREVWLCELCNMNPKAFCAECMIKRTEAINVQHLAD